MRTAILCCIFVVLIQLISGQEDLFAICDAKSGDIESKIENWLKCSHVSHIF